MENQHPLKILALAEISFDLLLLSVLIDRGTADSQSLRIVTYLIAFFLPIAFTSYLPFQMNSAFMRDYDHPNYLFSSFIQFVGVIHFIVIPALLFYHFASWMVALFCGGIGFGVVTMFIAYASFTSRIKGKKQ